MDCWTSKQLFSCILFVSIIKSLSCLDVTIIKPKVNDSCGISTGGPLVQQLTSTISFAGCLFWADNGDKIAYVDRFGSAFGRYTPTDGHFNKMSLPEAKEYTFVFPVANTEQLLFVVGKDRGMILVNVTGSGSNLVSKTQDLMTITNDKKEHVIVARSDSNGSIWISTGSYHGQQVGKIYRIDNLQEPVVVYEGLYMGAGMAWSPDNKYFYLVEFYLQVIYRFDFDITDGTISNRKIVFNMTEQNNLGGIPYDITVSNDGMIWIGMLHGGSVIEYDPDTEEIIWQITVPASDIVSLTFGNMDKRTLYVGTAKHWNTKSQPAAGAIFAISGLGATGRTEIEVTIPAKYLS